MSGPLWHQMTFVSRDEAICDLGGTDTNRTFRSSNNFENPIDMIPYGTISK